MDKRLLYAGKSEKGVFTHLIDAERSYLEKTAAQYHPTIASYINSAKPIKGKTQILLTALGAGEWWGDNANADYFAESELAHAGPDYGYQTFEQWARVYKHHLNKDPNNSYGNVPLSIYNPEFHRCELIILLDNHKAPDIQARIENGDYPDWSMGCLPGNAPILMADYTYRPVSELQSGDAIINAKGLVGKVSYPHNHKHTGRWYHVSSVDLREHEVIPTTEEHPWLVIPRSQVQCAGNPLNKSRRINTCLPNKEHKKGCQQCPNGVEGYAPKWKRADELEVGDYIATPILQGEVASPGEAMAWLAGIYLAQGHITSAGYIQLTVNIGDSRIFEKLCSLLPDKNIQWRPREAANAADINIYDKSLVPWLREHCGHLAQDKRLSPEAMRWGFEAQKIFLGAYLDGDGGVYKDACYYSTCNRELAVQVQAVLLRVGCIASLNTIHHKPSALVNKETTEYQVWVGQDSSQTLKAYSFKAHDIAPPKMYKNLRFIANGCLWSPITGIRVEDCDEDVYNIAVDSGDYDSDSYVVGNYAVHNCKIPYDVCNICGNKAPSRKQYCEHAKYYLGQIHPATQKKVFLYNIKPRFFDISYVLLGADRIAKTLLKVAHARPSYYGMSSAALAEKLAERAKQATIEKQIPANDATPPGSQEMLNNARALLEAIPEVKAREKVLPKKTLDELAEMPLHSSLSTMAMLGIAPKPQEFQRLFLISKGLRQLADALDARNACFDPMMAADSPDMDAVDIGGKHVNERAVSLLSPHMEGRSYAAPFLGRRILLMIKSGAQEQPLPVFIKSAEDTGDRKPIGILPVMMAAAGAYAAFSRKAPAGSLQGIDKLLQSNAGLGLATALGIGLLSVFHHTFGPKVKGQLHMNAQENPDANDIFARIEDRKQKPYLKLGGSSNLGAAAKRLFLGIPVAYMASGVLQKHRDINPSEQEGRAKSFLRQNPDLVSGGLIADAMLSARGGGTHKMLKNLGSQFAKAAEAVDEILSTDFAKTADAQDFLASAVTWPLAIGNANLPGRIAGGLFDQAMIEATHKFMKSRQKKSQSPT